MLKTVFAALVVALAFVNSPVLAQSTKIFLASTGLDSNNGSLASPKRTFQAGHDAVAAGGQLVVLDTAGYGALSINKSVSITVPPGVNGFVTVTSGNGVTINAGATDQVTLRGLIIEGPGAASGGVGINATSVGTVIVEDTIVRNFAEGVILTSTTTASLVVRGGAVRNANYGIHVESSSINNVNALVTDTELTGLASFALFVANTSVGSAHLVATRCAVSNSGTAFFASGANGQVLADGCTVTGNNVVFGNNAASRGNNTLYNNTTPGSASPIAPQ